jgi:23S rRNA (adenine2503-C2)-methyltransferase
MHLLSLTSSEFTGIIHERWGKGPFLALAAYRRILKHGCAALATAPEFSSSPALARDMCASFDLTAPDIAEIAEDAESSKIVFTLADGEPVESVWLPLPRRATLCVSTQAGCRMGCAFCRTGARGFTRDLRPEEIAGQAWAVRHRLGRPVDNIVFMGMGEPLDNFDSLCQAIRVLSDQHGLDIAHSRITVSTSGIPEGIRRLGELGWPRLNLAVSLNAANDALRSRLMPINSAHPLEQLKNALLAYPLHKRGVFLIEYVLLKGVNDGPEHAAELAEFVEDLPVRVNVIAYNPGSDGLFESPGEQECRVFCKRLADAGIFVRLRSSRGQSVHAGCGQLGGTAKPGITR